MLPHIFRDTPFRVTNIIETMTYMCYRYINRGLYEKDKLTFILLVTMKILITAALLKASDLTIFLRGGAALDINSVSVCVCGGGTHVVHGRSRLTIGPRIPTMPGHFI